MPFIGNQPALSYTSFAKQDFTTSATTSYTLDNPVANANELALFINFVRQEPTTAYSASGTTLTLTSATSASDDMYCVFLGKAVQTVNPPSGSVGASQIVDSSIALGKLSATGTKDSTTFLRGDNTFASAGGTNTPAFFAYPSSSQAYGATNTKINLNTELFDTDSNFASGAFTPTTAGKYFIYGQIFIGSPGTSFFGNAYIWKNGGSEIWQGSKATAQNVDFSINVSAIISMNGSSDYLELYGYNNSSKDALAGSQFTYMTGYKIIE